MIKAIPQTYAGVRFRSTLEADWAATLDSLGIVWQYEPEGIQLPSGALYRPDFYLPRLSTWLEVKGPLGERLEKTSELAEAVMHAPECTGIRQVDDWSVECGDWWDPRQLVIIGEAPTYNEMTFRGAYNNDDNEAGLARCRACNSAFFYLNVRSYRCRACSEGDGDHHLGRVDLSFSRATRG